MPPNRRTAILIAVCVLYPYLAPLKADPVVPPRGGVAVVFEKPFWLTGVANEVDAFSASFPIPATSEHFKVANAGYWIGRRDKPNEAFYFYQLNVTKRFESRVYTQMLLQDPEDAHKYIQYEHYLEPGEGSTRVTHGPLRNVKRGQQYSLVLEVFADEARLTLIERVEQTIVAPFDNRSGCVDLEEIVKRPLFATLSRAQTRGAPLDKMILACDR
jgi:hypothetical protein